jgi:micrococcal nuclease
MYLYRANLEKVIDGDTLEVTIDLGFNIFRRIKIRLKDIDTPEIFRPSCEKEKAHGEKAKAFVEDFLMGTAYSGSLIIKTIKNSNTRTRYTAVVYRYLGGFDTRNQPTLTEALKEHGFEKKELY